MVLAVGLERQLNFFGGSKEGELFTFLCASSSAITNPNAANRQLVSLGAVIVAACTYFPKTNDGPLKLDSTASR